MFRRLWVADTFLEGRMLANTGIGYGIKSVFANYMHSSSHLIQSYWPITYLAEPLVLNNQRQLDCQFVEYEAHICKVWRG
jgi:hypothetical protein